jgi:hypothetical protein
MKEFCAAGIRTCDLKKNRPFCYCLDYRGLAKTDLKKKIYIFIFITKFEINTPGVCSTFRHNKHSNVCRTVTVPRLIQVLGKYPNFKTIEL